MNKDVLLAFLRIEEARTDLLFLHALLFDITSIVVIGTILIVPDASWLFVMASLKGTGRHLRPNLSGSKVTISVETWLAALVRLQLRFFLNMSVLENLRDGLRILTLVSCEYNTVLVVALDRVRYIAFLNGRK